MSWLFDLIALAIVVITVIVSARRGFVRVVVEVIGFILAVLITFTIHTPLAEMTYDKIIEPPVVEAVTKTGSETAGQTADRMWNALPELVKSGSSLFGITKEKIDQDVEEKIAQNAESTATNLSQSVIKPAVVRFLALIYAVVLLIVLLIAVKFLAKAINKLFSFSLVGKVNRVLGGILGIPKGIVFAVLFCLIISLIVSFTKNGFLIFTREMLDGSRFYSLIVGTAESL